VDGAIDAAPPAATATGRLLTTVSPMPISSAADAVRSLRIIVSENLPSRSRVLEVSTPPAGWRKWFFGFVARWVDIAAFPVR